MAATANIPESQTLLIAMIVFTATSTVRDDRNPTGDYRKVRARRSGEWRRTAR